MKKLHYLILIVVAFTIHSCTCTPAINYNHSIVVNDSLLVGFNNGSPINNSIIKSELENPVISGGISFNENLERVFNPRSFTALHENSCCKRMEMNVPDNATNKLSSPLISIYSTSPLIVNDKKLYLYDAPCISLPVDGSPVNLSLTSEGETLVTGTIALDERVIVLPVYVHVFMHSSEPLTPLFDQDNLASAFDNRSFITTGMPQPAGSTNFQINTKPLKSPYFLADTIWKQAHIQFKLINYFPEPDDMLAHQIMTSNGASAADLFHNNYIRNHPEELGIHIYIGKNSDDTQRNGGIIAGVTNQPVGCNNTAHINDRNYIALASDEASGHPNALAHELGHFLGLDDSESMLSCGISLLDEGEDTYRNLMNSGAGRAYHLSAKQIEGARIVACKHLLRWRITCPACTATSH